MSLEYVRKHYGLKIERGSLVNYNHPPCLYSDLFDQFNCLVVAELGNFYRIIGPSGDEFNVHKGSVQVATKKIECKVLSADTGIYLRTPIGTRIRVNPDCDQVEY